jgi:ketosteroid isomerase-like protein
MRRLAIFLVLTGCATAHLPDVRAAHETRFHRMMANDLDALAPMLADDLVYVHSDGVMETKPQFLERVRSGRLRYRSIVPTETTVRTYGNVAMVTGRGKFTVIMSGGDLEVDLRYTSVYRHSPDGWQLVSWQSTRVP